MNNGFMVVTEKDWEKATPEQRDWYIFNTLQSLNERLKKLEKQTLLYKVYAFAGGVVGGAIAALGIKLT
ncbi:MAG: hypothetical protein JXI32_01885 [Deltaproteobacteria bacterium]|nr:hypothetical protein [Deltaproteobacteria bacterium]